MKIYFLGMVLHLICLVCWLIKEKGKIKIPKSNNEKCLLIIIAVRALSELIVHRGISTYSVLYYLLCFFVILFFYQIEQSQSMMLNIQDRVSWCIFIIGLICSLFAIMYYIVGLGKSFAAFSFRFYRIGGFLFDSILAGFMYGIGLLSAFDLYRRKRLSGFLTIVSIIIFLIGCLLTGSRGSFYFIILAMTYYIGNKLGFSRYVVVGLFVALGAVLYSTFLAEENVSFVSDSARSYKYALALSVFKNKPIFGVGTNMFHYHDLIYGSNPHNLPLAMLSENGVVGFIPYVMWFICNMVNLKQTTNSYWRWMSISFFVLSMIFGVLSNMITVIIMVMVTWGCDTSKYLQD